MLYSLHRRCNLTSVSNFCKAVLKSLSWTPNRLNKLLKVRFKFPFILIGKWTMSFLTGQSWLVRKSWYTCGGQNKEFGTASQTDLTRV